MRYTEVRMDRLAEELLADIDKETVDFGPNYDDSHDGAARPADARSPTCWSTAARGIAVGMATNIPPHNMGEVIDATLHLIDNPKATVRGPDEVHPRAGLPDRRLHHRARGHPQRLRDRPRAHHAARAHRDRDRARRPSARRIIVTEIPYQVNKARLIEKIAELVREKKLEGISDIRDESDRQGMRIVIELKRDAISGVVLNNLFANTPLQTTFGIVLLAIDGGQPRTLTLKEMLERFIAHRREVVTRRSRFELRKAEAPAAHRRGPAGRAGHHRPGHHHHPPLAGPGRGALGPDARPLAGALRAPERFKDLPRLDLAKAKAQMDALVARARERGARPTPGSRTSTRAAASREEQAKNILEMRLQRLTGMQREELFKELIDAASGRSPGCEDILANESSLLNVIKTELQGDPRALRRRAPHRDHRRGRRAHQRGPDRRRGHGGHAVATPAT